ncbi:hypothetical protein A9Q91_06030 [Candidatus Gracilibacteria bacterium 28_42_T64]|nr:hypothetical protein A9Q91_06030 [Candidatus Gracilibacteria bacterium 28_42_T64]
MAGKFEQILSTHFEQDEIQQLESMPDYEATKKRIEQIHADDMLAHLEAKVNAEIIDKKLSLNERFQKFQQSIGEITDSAESKSSATQLNPEVYIASQKKEMREEFLTTLSGGSNPDITDTKTWTGMLGVWAFEQIENGEKLDKNSSFVDKITTGFMSKIGITLLSFLGLGKAFSAYKNGSENIQLPVEEEKERTISTNSEQREARRYSGATLIFLNIINRENNTEVFDNLNFQNLTFAQLLEFKEASYHNQKFNDFFNSLPEHSYSRREITGAIDTLIDGKGRTLIDDIFSKSEYKNDYKTFSVKKLFLLMGENIELLGSVQTQSILTQASTGDFKNMDEETKNYLNKRALSENIFSLARDESNYTFDNKKNILAKLDGTEGIKDGMEKERVTELVEYGFDIQSNLFQKEDGAFQIYEGGKKISDIFIADPLSLREVITLRIITGEVTEFNKMNSIQQSALYLSLIGFLKERGENETFGNYLVGLGKGSADIANETGDELSGKIPQGVKNIIGDAFKVIADTSAEQAGNMLETTIGMVKESPLLGIGAGALLLFGPWFVKRQNVFQVITR